MGKESVINTSSMLLQSLFGNSTSKEGRTSPSNRTDNEILQQASTFLNSFKIARKPQQQRQSKLMGIGMGSQVTAKRKPWPPIRRDNKQQRLEDSEDDEEDDEEDQNVGMEEKKEDTETDEEETM